MHSLHLHQQPMAKILEIVTVKIARFLYGIFIWAINASMPKRRRLTAATPPPQHCNEHVGLACLLCSPHAQIRVGRVLHSCAIQRSKPSRSFTSSPSTWPYSWSSSSYSYPWDKSTSGDILGTESGVFFCSDLDIPPWEDSKPYVPKQSLQGRVRIEKKRDIPPPISILRKDGPNYKGIMPSCLEDHDVTERCEYLQTIRDQGRLIMNLVVVDPKSSSEKTRNEGTGEQEMRIKRSGGGGP